jgi:TPR repeat protein
MLSKKREIFGGLLTLICLSFVLYFLLNRPSEKIERPVHSSASQLSSKIFSEMIQSCNKGDGEKCLTVGYVFLRGVTGERNFVQAQNYFEKACDTLNDLNKRELECEAIAHIFEEGKEARVDRKIAQVFHAKAKAIHLSNMSAGLAKQPVERDEFLCDAGEAGSCFHFGVALLDPVRRDLKRAEEVLMKTCESGDSISKKEEYPGKLCGMAGEIFEFGKLGMPVDLDKAGAIYRKACDIAMSEPHQNGFMCDVAGSFYRYKKSNQHLAASLFQRACKMGYQTSCDHLRRMGEKGEL